MRALGAARGPGLVDKRGRWQYKGVLIEAIVTILAEGEDDVYEEVVERMQKHGVDMGEEKEEWKWLAARVEWAGIEGTRMRQLFYRLASGHRVGREKPLGVAA
jgi:hypothetical protein